MSTMHEERKLIVTMNPDELRELADKMEREFPKKVCGDSTFIGFLAYSPSFMVCLHADQKWFHMRESGSA